MQTIRNTIRYPSLGLTALLVVLFAAACASVDPGSVSSTIGKAETGIEQAQNNQASKHAPLALRKAKDKLGQAREAFDADELQKALYLAEESLVEVELARAG